MDWKKLLKGVARVGKLTAVEILRAKFPISMQTAEYLIGAGKGELKLANVVDDGIAALKAAQAAGRLSGDVPSADTVKQIAQEVFDELKQSGTLEEISLLKMGGKTFRLVEVEEK